MRLALKFGRGILLRPEAKSGREKAVKFPHYFTNLPQHCRGKTFFAPNAPIVFRAKNISPLQCKINPHRGGSCPALAPNNRKSIKKRLFLLTLCQNIKLRAVLFQTCHIHIH